MERIAFSGNQGKQETIQFYGARHPINQLLCNLCDNESWICRYGKQEKGVRIVLPLQLFSNYFGGDIGRSELPDNLKAIVRPVSMMVPDFTLIAEIMMFSEGFQTAKILAKKMIAIMELSQQQLSKQDHYDYGLRYSHLLEQNRVEVIELFVE